MFFGGFSDVGEKAFWWSSTGKSGDAWARILKSDSKKVVREMAVVNQGFSVRCLKD